MSKILLLGAGFSRNWGGWLASEAFDYLLSTPEVAANLHVRELLWRTKEDGGFESALAEVQRDYVRAPHEHLANLNALQGAVGRMFLDMNRGLLAHNDLEFQNARERMLATALVKFDAIFTLNQDLLLEHRYLNDNVMLLEPGRWNGYQLPGLRRRPSATFPFPEVRSLANQDWSPFDPCDFHVEATSQPLFKLHGSSNWTEQAGNQLMVIGGNKENEIRMHPILTWYHQQFERLMAVPQSRLMIIGYGFRDAHINRAIEIAAQQHGLRMFVIDPLGSDLARALNSTATPGQIRVQSPLEALFRQALCGASRRSLREIFGGDGVEHAKVMRFFE